jgi:acetyl-CoA carboxylase carboxyl transferase subunit beta
LLDHGMIDAIVPRSDLRNFLANALAVLAPHLPRSRSEAPAPVPLSAPVDPWTTVELARDPNRPTARDYIKALSGSFLELRGDRAWADDPNVVAGIARVSGQATAVVGFERRWHPDGFEVDGRPRPEGFRKAQRLLRLAARLHIPVVTLIDTPGAYPGVESEERGLAGQIAETMALMNELPVPTVAAIVGEGGSGGALALAIADRVLMQERAIYSVISPEGAAAILYRDGDQAPSVAKKLGLTAPDLFALGIVDRIVAEPGGGAAIDPRAATHELSLALQIALDEVLGRSRDRLLKARRERYRRVGTHWIVGTESGSRAERVLRWAWDSRTNIRLVLPSAIAGRLPG